MKIIHWTIKIGWEDGTEEYISDIPNWVTSPVDSFLTSLEEETEEEEENGESSNDDE